MRTDYVFIGGFQLKEGDHKGDYLCAGHLAMQNGYNVKVTYIRCDPKTFASLVPLEVYEVQPVEYYGDKCVFGFVVD